MNILVKKINRIINSYYNFMGYDSFANYVTKLEEECIKGYDITMKEDLQRKITTRGTKRRVGISLISRLFSRQSSQAAYLKPSCTFSTSHLPTTISASPSISPRRPSSNQMLGCKAS
jgi:hypothetical protein